MNFRHSVHAFLLTFIAAAVFSGCSRSAPLPIDATAGWAWEIPSPPPPPMAWVPAGAFRKAERTPQNVTAIVIHTTEGRWNDEETHIENQERNFRSVVKYFMANDRNVSAHYVVGRNGEICQMVNETDVAHTQTYYNGRAFGIECAGWGRRAETWTPENLEALVNLCAYLCVKWDIPAYHPEGTAYEGPNRITIDEDTKRFTAHGLVGHYQVQPWNKSDPGEYFPWEEFCERVRARIREYGVEPIELPAAEITNAAEIVASAGIKEEVVRPNEPFTYVVILRGPGAEMLTVDDVTLPDFTVVDTLAVVSEPHIVESSPGRAVVEVQLTTARPDSFSLGASRISLDGTWYDTGTLPVKPQEAAQP